MSSLDKSTKPSRQSGNIEDAPDVSNIPQVMAPSVSSAEQQRDPFATGDGSSLSTKSDTTQEGGAEDLIDLGDEVSKADEVTMQAEADIGELGNLQPHSKENSDHVDPMSSSIATLKPTTPTTTTAAQYLTVESSTYVDPTPPTPVTSQPPSRTPSHSASSRGKHKAASADPSPTRSDAAYDEKRYGSEEEQEGGPKSEIQSIMTQFSGSGGPGAEEVMSPRLEMASPMLTSPVQHPPRKSSLEPLAPNIAHELERLRVSSTSPVSIRGKEKEREDAPPVPPKDGTVGLGLAGHSHDGHHVPESPLSPSLTLHRPPPPEPEPEPALTFDFHRFLEQLRNKKADPVARYLKSFLQEFGKRQWMVHEQVKIIGDFLAFIANKMAQCEVWRDVSDAEFDNAREGMEKLVMNRLYTQTFSPAIPPPQPVPGAKSKKRGGDRLMGPGRRGQHQEDVERDDILAQKIAIYSWTKEEHLDIPPVSESGKRFLKLAQQELLKIKSYRAPRDKIICVLNSCKVIFGLLKHSKSDGSADSFMPMLIYVVLHANPEHLVSNVQYILRFRNQDKLGGEAGYYLSSLMGAIQFIENMDRTSLTITDEEFEANVEAAVSAIAERHKEASASESRPPSPPSQSEKPSSSLLQPPPATGSSTSSTRPSMDTSRTSTEGRGSSDYEDKAAITGLFRTIQKPLSSIGRIFSDEGTSLIVGSGDRDRESSRTRGDAAAGPARTPQPESSPSGALRERQHLSAEEAAARQASAEAAEAQRLHRAEHANIVETLAGMFPDLDREIISDVVYQKEGRVGLAVDACLALST